MYATIKYFSLFILVKNHHIALACSLTEIMNDTLTSLTHDNSFSYFYPFLT